MVSAELATAVPALLLVLVAGVGAVRVGVDQLRCVDAARLGARAAARGDPPAEVRALTARAAPKGAQVSIGSARGEVRVVVTATTGGWAGFVPSWSLLATATTPVEQGAG